MSKDPKNFSFLEFNELISKQFVSNPNTNQNYEISTDEIGDSNKQKKSKQYPQIESNNHLKFAPIANITRTQKVENNNSLNIPEKLSTNIEEITNQFKNEQSLINKNSDIANKKNKQNQNVNTENKKIDKSRNDKVPITMKKDESEILTDEIIQNKLKKFEHFKINNIIKNVKNNDPNAYIPVILPFGDDKDNEENEGNINFSEDKLYLFQFPRQIPIDLDIQQKTKIEETINEEPSYDKNGYLIRPKFKNVFEELPNNTKIGKLKVYKNGEVKIDINNIDFNVIKGVDCKFAQQAAVLSCNITNKDKEIDKNNQVYLLGNINSNKLIVIPEIK